MKLIQLTKGKQAIVDDDDYEELNQFKWYLNNGYACRTVKIDGVFKMIRMHVVVNQTPVGFMTDHINRNKLDNSKCNLRSVTRSINRSNTCLNTNNTSGFKRLLWIKNSKSWQIEIVINKQKVYRKTCKDKNKAIEFLLSAEKIHLPKEFWQTKPELVC